MTTGQTIEDRETGHQIAPVVSQPLAFTCKNIAAIRDGRKTKTRRPIKPTFSSAYDDPYKESDGLWYWHHDYEYERWVRRAPKYEVGDRVPVANSLGDATGIVLEITATRPEKLNEISEEDAKAEGVQNDARDGRPGHIHRELFRELWATIYGPTNDFAWERNPWVWVYEVKVVVSG